MPNAMAQLIRERRQDLGLTQQQLADRIGGGARQAEVSRLEQGHVALPRRLRMEQIARALEIPIGELLVRSGWVGADTLDTLPDSSDTNREESSPGDDEGLDIQEVQESVDELQELNADLRASVNKLQNANDRLRDRGLEKATELRTAEAIVEQLRVILNTLPDPVVVVSRTGFVVVENTAYSVFEARHSDTPTMLDETGAPIPEDDLPLARASRGDQFTMGFVVEGEGERIAYKAVGQPASTVQGGLVGVVSIQEDRS